LTGNQDDRYVACFRPVEIRDTVIPAAPVVPAVFTTPAPAAQQQVLS
jgi:peptide/nickel transport system ATP-binding protein